MELTQILKEVNEHYGKEIFVLDDQESCRALVGDGLVVEILHLPEVGRIMLYADIGREPQEGRDQVYRLMLQAQHLFQGTAGASFGLDGETGSVYLERPVSLATLTAESFVTDFEVFAQVALKWRKALEGFIPLAEEIESLEKQAVDADRRAREGIDVEGFIVA